MTENQQALVNLIAEGKHRVVDYGDKGAALWRRDIQWSQGRTPANAISAEDLAALVAAGVVMRLDGELYMYVNTWRASELQTDKWIRWRPYDGPGVYRGEPLLR